ncbi:tRNA (adenine22-N1)-methyltransferase [Paenibacillus phyllosphaerae]|uniref:tRNA (Adenine22-N1)-methyltransferase n=1 Tax=Paenibacillus phyllosphaerae TaxID=274593 RepID=A0A7W5FLE5_9BACL|nr:class I SAM-dependent methyltransferase [Paenibacillus phyllosphaerae]MBB3109018.1 tRNA (adenine22-N1)-methyltransferase [Paenibacillus phyllosphaerae]
MIKLSQRLQTIADRVTPGSRVADIGSDHALLPVYLVQSGRSPGAIAGELNTGPFQAAQKQVASAGLKSAITVRQGNGLAVLEAGEADTVTIAGMGGVLMAEILEWGAQNGKLSDVKELVLQPNVGEDVVRQWLTNHGWLLQGETILEEDGRFYEVLHAQRTDDFARANEALYDPAFLRRDAQEVELWRGWLYRMGPYSLRSPSPLLHRKWAFELQKLERITAQVASSDQPEAIVKAEEFRKEIREIQEVLACTPTDRPSFN